MTQPSAPSPSDPSAPSPPSDPFDPPTDGWLPLAPGYAAVRRLDAAITYAVCALVLAVAAFLLRGLVPVWVSGIVLGAWIVLAVWRVVRVKALAESWRYAEREGDLCLRHGLLWRRLTIIPFGRMQLVELRSGPIQRAFGVTSVSMVTASTGSSSIPGLAPDRAAELRERMLAAAESGSSGL